MEARITARTHGARRRLAPPAWRQEVHMMRTICGAAVFAITAGSAAAADFEPYAAPVLTRAYTWTGPYVGGQFGYQWGNTTHNPTRPWGIAGGLQGGYNWPNGGVRGSSAHPRDAAR